MNYIKYTVYCIWWFLSFESLDLGTEAKIFLKFNLNPYTCANHVKISKICGALSRLYLPTFLESIVFKSTQTNLIKSGFKKKYSSSLNHKCITYNVRFGWCKEITERRLSLQTPTSNRMYAHQGSFIEHDMKLLSIVKQWKR